MLPGNWRDLVWTPQILLGELDQFGVAYTAGQTGVVKLMRQLAVEAADQRWHCQVDEAGAFLSLDVAPVQQAHVTASHTWNACVRSSRW